MRAGLEPSSPFHDFHDLKAYLTGPDSGQRLATARAAVPPSGLQLCPSCEVAFPLGAEIAPMGSADAGGCAGRDGSTFGRHSRIKRRLVLCEARRDSDGRRANHGHAAIIVRRSLQAPVRSLCGVARLCVARCACDVTSSLVGYYMISRCEKGCGPDCGRGRLTTI